MPRYLYCINGNIEHFLDITELISRSDRVGGGQTLTDGFPGVELGLGVSWYVSLVFGSQCVQLVFNDVLTLSHAEEAVPVPWRDTADRTQTANTC